MLFFFGHQSVGQDLVTGLAETAETAELPQRSGSAMEIVTLREYGAAHGRSARTSCGTALVHERLGRNREPLSKLAEFDEALRAWQPPLPDIAMLKFCYVDIETERGAEQLLDTYTQEMTGLQTRYPQIRFAHCTVPLRSLPSGMSAAVRRALGYRHPQLDANRAREWFNDRLRERHDGGLLFDLAKLQATRPDGGPCTVRDGGTRIRCLAPQWTDDGGHLNARGRTMAATALLKFFHAFGMSR